VFASLVSGGRVLVLSIMPPPFSKPRTHGFMITVDDRESLVLVNTPEKRSVLDSVSQLKTAEDRKEFLEVYFEIPLNKSIEQVILASQPP